MGADLRERERGKGTLGDAGKVQEHERKPQGIYSSPGGYKPSVRMHPSVSTTPLPGRKRTGDDSGADPGSTSRASSVRRCGLTHSMCRLLESSQQTGEGVAEPGQEESCCRPQSYSPHWTYSIATEHFSSAHPCSTSLLGVQCVPLTALGTRDISWNKTDPCSQGTNLSREVRQ